jgi:hypothetical protein
MHRGTSLPFYNPGAKGLRSWKIPAEPKQGRYSKNDPSKKISAVKETSLQQEGVQPEISIQ